MRCIELPTHRRGSRRHRRPENSPAPAHGSGSLGNAGSRRRQRRVELGFGFFDRHRRRYPDRRHTREQARAETNGNRDARRLGIYLAILDGVASSPRSHPGVWSGAVVRAPSDLPAPSTATAFQRSRAALWRGKRRDSNAPRPSAASAGSARPCRDRSTRCWPRASSRAPACGLPRRSSARPARPDRAVNSFISGAAISAIQSSSTKPSLNVRTPRARQ